MYDTPYASGPARFAVPGASRRSTAHPALDQPPRAYAHDGDQLVEAALGRSPSGLMPRTLFRDGSESSGQALTDRDVAGGRAHVHVPHAAYEASGCIPARYGLRPGHIVDNTDSSPHLHTLGGSYGGEYAYRSSL